MSRSPCSSRRGASGTLYYYPSLDQWASFAGGLRWSSHERDVERDGALLARWRGNLRVKDDAPELEPQGTTLPELVKELKEWKQKKAACRS
jgi:hypothetical protein